MTDHKPELEARWQRIQEYLSRGETTHLPEELLHLARFMVQVPSPQMTCDECQEWQPNYIEAEISGLAVGKLYPKVKHHLELCSKCAADYIQMLEWAQEPERIQPFGVEIPPADLSFLPRPAPVVEPPLSLIERVRLLTEKLIDSLWPALQRKYQATGDKFSRRLAKKGANFVFEPQVNVLSSGNKAPTVMQLLRTTHNITHKLVQEWSAEDLEREIKRGTLKTSVHQRAEEEARSQGFSPQEAQRFAEQYAEMVSEEPSFLKSLA